MNLNLRDFKKIKEDEHAAVLQHPEGHHIVLAKNILSPKLKGQLAELPIHKADGGEIPDDEASHQFTAKSAGQAEERARAADPQFQPQFPDASKQAPVVINVGQPQQPPPQQAQPPAQPAIPEAKMVNGVPFKNGTIDWDQYYLRTAGVPVETKMKALKNVQSDQAAEKANADYKVQQQQAAAQKAMEYNQMAAQMGLPSVDVPNAPPMAAPQTPPPAPVSPEAPAQAQASLPSDPYGTQAYQDYLLKGVQGQTGGLETEAKEQQKLGEAQAKVFADQAAAQQAQVKSYQDHYNEIDQERKNFQTDLQNAHVDAKRFLNSMGVGSKVSTGIGLILGGMGGGLTHQGNPALDFLNKQIDRDIQSQRDEIGKTENLLSANMRQFGNLKDATDMTRVMQMDIVKNQLADAAAKAQGPLAKARADQAIGQIDQQIAPIMAQMAMRKSLTSPQAAGGAAQDPASQIRMQSMMGFIPKEHVEPMFKELKEAEGMVRAKDNLLGAFEKLNQINTVGGRITRPLNTPKEVAAIRDPLIAQLSKETAGRFTEADSQFIGSLFPAPGDDAKTIQTKRNQLNKIISEKMNFPQLNAYGIRLGNTAGSSRFNEAGEKKLTLGAPVAPKR